MAAWAQAEAALASAAFQAMKQTDQGWLFNAGTVRDLGLG